MARPKTHSERMIILERIIGLVKEQGRITTNDVVAIFGVNRKDGEPRLHIKEQPVPVVPEECPEEIRDLMASHSDALFNDDDAQEIWNACRAAMLNGGKS